MRTTTYQVVAILLVLSTCEVFARDLEAYQKTCADIGFKKGTPAYGDCVLELDRRASSTVPDQPKPQVRVTTPTRLSPAYVPPARQVEAAPPPPPPIRGDGTPDDGACQSYGFSVGSSGYSDCRMKLSTARMENERAQREYELRKRQYDEQVAANQAAEAAARRQAELRKAQCHFRSSAAAAQPGATLLGAFVNMAACENGAAGPPIVPPTPPPPPSIVHCNYSGNTMTCF